MRLECRQPLSPHGGITRPFIHPPPAASHVPSSKSQPPPHGRARPEGVDRRRCDRAWRYRRRWARLVTLVTATVRRHEICTSLSRGAVTIHALFKEELWPPSPPIR